MSRDRTIRDLERQAKQTRLPGDVAALRVAIERSGRLAGPHMIALGLGRALATIVLEELKAEVEAMPWPLPYRPGAPLPPLAKRWPMSVRETRLTAIGIDAVGRRQPGRVVIIAETASTGHLRAGVSLLGRPAEWRKLPSVRRSEHTASGFSAGKDPDRFPAYALRALGLLRIPARLHPLIDVWHGATAPTLTVRRPDRKPGDAAGWSRRTG